MFQIIHTANENGREVLAGAAAIAGYLLGDPKKRRKVYDHSAGLPIYRVGRIYHARKAALDAFMLDQERSASFFGEAVS